MDVIPFRLDDIKVADKLFEKIRYFVAGTVDPQVIDKLKCFAGIQDVYSLMYFLDLEIIGGWGGRQKD